MSRRRKKLKPYKVSRGSFEEQKLKEANKAETQCALLFILPVLMAAVLAVGVFFGYKSYLKGEQEKKMIVSESLETVEEKTDPMLLTVVSSAYPLDESYVPELVDLDGVQIAPVMADSLKQMLADAEKAGCPINLAEGYISFKEQKKRYDAAVQRYLKSSKSTLVKAESQVKLTIPREGESEQQTGLLVKLDDDVKGRFENSAAFKWLKRNAVDYGFVLRYPAPENVGGLAFSPSLFRYVGKENAYNMRAYNMTFDEYAVYTAYR